MRKVLVTLSALLLLTSVAPAFAGNQCRDAKGKFIKCPDKDASKPVRCKDAKGKFAKCGAPGAKPA